MDLLLPANSTVGAAVFWLQQLVCHIGMGFHLDAPTEDYVFPDGKKLFTAIECEALKLSFGRLLSVLGEEPTYEICDDEGTTILLESLEWKPHLEYHDPANQKKLLRVGTREEIISWLCWNDPNGIYLDHDSIAEDRSPLSLEEARQIMRDQIHR